MTPECSQRVATDVGGVDFRNRNIGFERQDFDWCATPARELSAIELSSVVRDFCG